MQFFWSKHLVFVSVLFFSGQAWAGYEPLPATGCPALQEFNLDHYAELFPMNNCGNAASNDQSTRLFRSGAPFLSGLACLKSTGVTIVIDLRKEGEVLDEPAQVAQAGMKYVPFPMTADPQIPGSQACLQQKLNAEQCNEQSALAAIQFMDQTLSANPTAKILVHCSRGQDRTGLVIGLYRLLKSKCSATDARNEMNDFMFTPYSSLLSVWNKYKNN